MAEWTVSISADLTDELKRSLLIADQTSRTTKTNGLIFMVDRLGKLTIEVFSDEEPPPHFRVRCSEGICRFRISDGKPIDANGLSRYFREIKKWHKKHKQELINSWNQRRPTDCPVREYHEK